jgi:hypothetical protein
MEEDVHGFAADNVPGIPLERQPVSYGNNGNLNKYPKKSLHQKHHRHQMRDVAERAMDEEVHGFVADNVPGTAWERQPVPYGENGNLNKYPPTKKSLHQKHH